VAMLTLGLAVLLEYTCSTFGNAGGFDMGTCSVLRLQMHVSQIGHSLVNSLTVF
jgi:hypothetical protein